MRSLLTIMTEPERAKINDASDVLQTIMASEMDKITACFAHIQKALRAQITTTEKLKQDLAKEGLFFQNFYPQISTGTSSDSEFTLLSSLMPAASGTIFVSYFNRNYITIPKLLQEKGYYTFAMHGNNADYWNRRRMHKNLGYDKLYAKADYNIDEVIGLGLSDESFFKQSVEKLEKIASENEKYYGTFIMLTNHTPFSDVEKYGEFAVSLKETGVNPETGVQEEIIYPYMEGTKLGNYLKSVHYADYALGIFFDELENKGLLENNFIKLESKKRL